MDAKFNVSVNPRIRELRDLVELDNRDMRWIANSIDTQFTKNEAALFASQGSSGGPAWPALSPKYAAWKRKVRPGRKIMQFDGNLRKSLVNRNDPGHAFSWRLNPAVVSVGTKDEKAAYHGPPDGNPLRNNKLPVRDVLQHTPQQEQGYLDIAKGYFAKTKLPRVARALMAWRRAAGRGGA